MQALAHIRQWSLRRRAARLGLALAVTCALSGTASALEPADSREAAAVNARVLQTELMVAALTCGMKPRYNLVVTRHRSALIGHGRVLRDMYRRAYGGGGQSHLDRYITRLANQASARSNIDRIGYCETAANLFDDALADDNSFDQFSARIVQEALLPGLTASTQ